MYQSIKLLLISIALISIACQEQAKNEAAPKNINAEVPSTQPKAPFMVEIEDNFKAPIEVKPIERAQIAQTLDVAGRLSVDEAKVSRIGSNLTGRLLSVNAQVGQKVASSTVLATINSTELNSAQLNFLKAHSIVDLQTKNVERAQALFKADVISSAELQKRENELQIALAEEKATADQLMSFGMNEGSVKALAKNRTIKSQRAVISPLNGVVIEKHVTTGQVVQAADPLFVVADLSSLWIVANVPEAQAGGIKIGQDIEVTISSLNIKIHTNITYIADVINSETRTLAIRADLDNANGTFKPDMFATIRIEGQSQERLLVPSSAVVREQNKEHVFVKLSDKVFRLVPVTLEQANETGLRAISSGLTGDESIVTNGAFHLNTERQRLSLQ